MLILAALLAGPAAEPPGETRAQNEAAALALHRRLDANHDGYVTYAEERAAALAMVVPEGRSLDRMPDDRLSRAEFDRADTDHDGSISAAEAIAGADRAFADADTDHDGILSPAERGAYVAKSLAALQAEIATWRPLPCRPGAACARTHMKNIIVQH